jgi:two-component system sensor histidine kinase GlrK
MNIRLSIFARFIISYLFLFAILAGVSLYSIYQLSQMNEITHSIIANDTSVQDYSTQLTDALLSEVRNDRKYVVLKDDTLFAGYLQAKDNFSKLLEKAYGRADSDQIRHLFYAIGVQHENFGRLVIEERKLVMTSKQYASEKYEELKKNISDDIIEQLQQVNQISDKNVFNKILNLSEKGDKAKNVFIVIAIFALTTGLLVAFFITRSIKIPLDLMRKKTVKISKGDFEGDLNITSPPVIAELAASINTMCHELQEVDRIKSDFFSHMSHELRTPLTSIREGTSMLLEGLGGEVTERQDHILRIIVQESNRMIDLVNALLDISKMEAGMMKYQFETIDLSVIARESVEVLTPLAEARNITIDNKITADFLVKADQERIHQVFRNLVGNAVKFTPEKGRIVIDAMVKDGVVQVVVHDTGVGIKEENLERIFHKFQQIITEKDRTTKGTGLGLATVKQIILAHGGHVWAKSQIEKGSTFYFTLPSAA